MPYIQTEMWTGKIEPPSDNLIAHLKAVRERDEVGATDQRGMALDKLYAESEHPDVCLVMEALGIYGQSG